MLSVHRNIRSFYRVFVDENTVWPSSWLCEITRSAEARCLREIDVGNSTKNWSRVGAQVKLHEILDENAGSCRGLRSRFNSLATAGISVNRIARSVFVRGKENLEPPYLGSRFRSRLELFRSIKRPGTAWFWITWGDFSTSAWNICIVALTMGLSGCE